MTSKAIPTQATPLPAARRRLIWALLLSLLLHGALTLYGGRVGQSARLGLPSETGQQAVLSLQLAAPRTASALRAIAPLPAAEHESLLSLPGDSGTVSPQSRENAPAEAAPVLAPTPSASIDSSAATPKGLPFSANNYADADTLDERPTLLAEPPISLPTLISGDDFASGQVVLRVFLSADGRVAHIITEQSSLPPIYAEVIGATLEHSLFRPGMKLGRSVASALLLEVTIDKSGKSTVNGLTPLPPDSAKNSPP